VRGGQVSFVGVYFTVSFGVSPSVSNESGWFPSLSPSLVGGWSSTDDVWEADRLLWLGVVSLPSMAQPFMKVPERFTKNLPGGPLIVIHKSDSLGARGGLGTGETPGRAVKQQRVVNRNCS